MLTRLNGARTPVARVRSPWTTLATRFLSTAAGDGAAALDAVGVAESASAKKRRQQAKEFELLPAALDDFAKSTGHHVVPLHLPIPLLNQAGQAPPKALNKRVRQVYVYGLVEDVNEVAWRDEVRGIKLGRVLKMFLDSNHRQRKQPHVVAQLLERGFVRGDNSRDLETHAEYKWRCQTKPALRVFHEIHGHSMVHQQFLAPRDDSRWPVATKGFPLGVAVNVIRRHQDKLTSQQLADLQAIDFSLNVFEMMWSEKVLPSLEVFARVYGHCHVRQDFAVPSSKPWPQKAWGLNLGTTVNAIRSQGIYADQVARDKHRLEAIQFVWNEYEHQWSERTLPSLEVFFAQFGHCDVRQDFAVPSSEPWPQKAWGLNLGTTANAIRSHGIFAAQVARDQHRLEAIQFVWDDNEHQWSHRILPSLETYYGQYGDCLVPVAFVVPTEAPWPEEAWGLNLGLAVQSLRAIETFAEQVKRDHARLEAIGFSWNVSQDRWDKAILPALETFFQLHGHSDVPQKFVVPCEAPWPQRSWGLNLGWTCRSIRSQGNYAKQSKRDEARLKAINFRVDKHHCGSTDVDQVL